MISASLEAKAQIAAGYIAHIDGRGDGDTGMTHGPATLSFALACEATVRRRLQRQA